MKPGPDSKAPFCNNQIKKATPQMAFTDLTAAVRAVVISSTDLTVAASVVIGTLGTLLFYGLKNQCLKSRITAEMGIIS